MNINFQQIIAADLRDRQHLFVSTANRLGTFVQNVLAESGL